ncbi:MULTISPECIES: MerR family transcriptional regulator [unclassified Microbacterium]|uniref:helix-turn-helix domain-containing protein n=1 Tax=unclassified Microbacterium TaxID=2609290 RepID=UPI000EAA3C3C|nr:MULTISPECIES: MerR family transcriptional regulator [unclassified Microbacterium]MBT2486174.1 MerR family transcriptional regulator [Microbacterium sp. ISL-108]RKN68900.1 MerR family transcriptional regulator [Microbacterium sp. CGR2]
MGWSTRELAELAGTSINTIRHYHRVGILDEPERRSNGYKQYQAKDLARVIRIRRLSELGVPLADVDSIGASGDADAIALRVIDAELAAGIERLQRARMDVAVMLEHRSSPDVPVGFSGVAHRLSDADRSVVTIYSQLLDQSALDDIARMIESEPPDIERDFTKLAPDAPDDERQRLAERIAPTLTQHLRDYPWLKAGEERQPHSSETADTALAESLTDLYDPAQLDVLRRAIILAHELAAT